MNEAVEMILFIKTFFVFGIINGRKIEPYCKIDENNQNGQN